MNRPGIVKHMTLLVVMLAAWSTTSTITAVGSEQFTVLNPTGYAPAIMRKPMAQRQTSLTGKTIYLVDNTFDNGDVYLKEMQKWFTANLPEVKTVFRSKKGAYYTDDPELWQEIQAAHGLMIMAIGH